MSAQPACLSPPGGIPWPLSAAWAIRVSCRSGNCLAWLSPGLVSALWLTAAALAPGLLLDGLSSPAALAQTQMEVSGLQCRLSGGPWQPCRMEVQDVGLRWVLRIGELRVEFRHSGDGVVRMQKGPATWQPVTATWQDDHSLCWDGVCAKGDIPLD